MAFRLPRLPRDKQLVDARTGLPTFEFQRWWQSIVKAIEDEFGALEAADAALAAAAAANAAADAAQTAADSANTAAGNAQGAADQAAADASLASSGASGVTLTATDAGANVTVSITAHTRVYGDGTSVSVNGGSVLALSYSTIYYIFYSDLSRAGGAVTYQASTDPADAAQTGGIHSVGTVETPAAAAPPVDGYGNLPPGVVSWI